MKANCKIVFIVYILTLILLAVLPINNRDSKLNHIYVLELRGDYWMHILVFIPWSLLCFVFFSSKSKVSNILFGLSFAFIAEGFQWLIPYRAFNVNDALANGVGVILGSTHLLFRKYR